MKKDNLVRLFRRQSWKQRDAVAIRHRRDGLWQSISWKHWEDDATAVASGLLSLNVKPGDTVGLLSRNCGAWLVSEVGILMAGAVPVPIPIGLTEAELGHVVRDSRARTVLVDAPHNLVRLQRAVQGSDFPFEKVIVFDDEGIVPAGERKGDVYGLSELFPTGDPPWLVRFDEFLEYGREQQPRFHDELERLREAALCPEDPALVIYTSGTTGVPRGVVLSHGNLLFEIERLAEAIPIDETDEQLLFLPLSHILGNVVCKSAFLTGSRIAIGEGVPHLLENIREVNPTYMTTVPLFCEKLVERVSSIARERGLLGGLTFDWARSVSDTGRRRRGASGLGGLLDKVQGAVAEQLVLKDLRRIMGSRLRFLISGGAHLSPGVGEFLHSIGIPVLEGYGLTETTAATHVNRPDAPEYGSVGLPLRGVDCRIAADGEIQVRGGNVMQGYFHDEAGTREVFTADGWFRTGDVGVMDETGRLTVTGKAKDLLVTSNGRNISPSKIESVLRHSPYVRQAVVFGDNRPFLVALVVLDEEATREFARGHAIEATDLAALARNPDVYRLIEQEIENRCRDLPAFERVRKFALLPRDLSAEAGEVTQTLKLRRDVIGKTYAALIESFYG